MPDIITSGPKVILKLHESVLKEMPITDELTIGRKADNHLVVEDPSVSGHHARIVKIHAVYFVEDLRSTNGTFVNNQRVDRKQLKDTDVITVGTHRLVFREDTSIPTSHDPALASDLDHTMVFSGSMARERKPTSQQTASMQIISGRTDQPTYTLNRALTIIGSQPDATIKLTGWFAPKVAAMISRRSEEYYLAVSEGGKTIRVNDSAITAQIVLKDGDVIEVAGVKMHFSLNGPAKI